MFAEVSVTGLTSHSFAILPNITSKPKSNSVFFSYLQISSYSFHFTIILYQKIPQCMVCHETGTSVLHDQHFLCEGCRDRWIEVKDCDNERRGVAQARLEVACPLCRKHCVLRNGHSGSVRIDPFFGFRMR